jgi:dTDP-4-amino-4,6-dideoxygalactose transaminase
MRSQRRTRLEFQPPALGEEEVDAVAETLRSGWLGPGPKEKLLEERVGEALGARNVVAVSSCTVAIELALHALDVGPGDEVITTPMTWPATANAIAHTGARPVFCDVDPETMLITADTVKAVMTPNTKAVIAVHLFGNIAPVDEIEALGVPVLEDAAQAAGTILEDGRRPGSLGTIATWSFYPSKNLGAFGDGGAITTNDDILAETVRTLRFHGSRDKQTFEMVGHNSRLDELQAGILRVQLPHLDTWADGRRAAGRHYEEAGLGELVSLPVATAGSKPAWHLYVVRSERADELRTVLNDAGIGARAYYRTPAHLQPAMHEWGAGLELPGTAEAARTNLAIPISPVLDRAQADEVVAAAAALAPA